MAVVFSSGQLSLGLRSHNTAGAGPWPAKGTMQGSPMGPDKTVPRDQTLDMSRGTHRIAQGPGGPSRRCA